MLKPDVCVYELMSAIALARAHVRNIYSPAMDSWKILALTQKFCGAREREIESTRESIFWVGFYIQHKHTHSNRIRMQWERIEKNNNTNVVVNDEQINHNCMGTSITCPLCLYALCRSNCSILKSPRRPNKVIEFFKFKQQLPIITSLLMLYLIFFFVVFIAAVFVVVFVVHLRIHASEIDGGKMWKSTNHRRDTTALYTPTVCVRFIITWQMVFCECLLSIVFNMEWKSLSHRILSIGTHKLSEWPLFNGRKSIGSATFIAFVVFCDQTTAKQKKNN